MSETPLTNAFIGKENDGSYMTEGEIAMCDFARKLERQRNELLEALQTMLKYDAASSRVMARAAITKAREPQL